MIPTYGNLNFFHLLSAVITGNCIVAVIFTHDPVNKELPGNQICSVQLPTGQLSLPDGGVAQHSENNAEGADLSAYENGAVRFSGTTDAGLYTLVIEDGSGSGERYFALRMPLSESDVRFTAPSIASDGAAAAFEGGKELTIALIALFLLLTMIEWVVRRRVA